MYFYPISSQYAGVYNPTEYDIATGTAIEKGEVVTISGGLIVACDGTDFDDPVIGVAAEVHDGATADGRQTGTKIFVYDNPSQIFATRPAKAITATNGSTTTFVDSNLGTSTDDLWNGGMLYIVSHAANSAYNGTYHNITDYTGSSDTITIGTTLSNALAAGDTAYLCPPKSRMNGQFLFDLNSDGTDIDWESTGGESMIIMGADPKNFIVHVKFRLHLLGNHVIAV